VTGPGELKALWGRKNNLKAEAIEGNCRRRIPLKKEGFSLYIGGKREKQREVGKKGGQ